MKPKPAIRNETSLKPCTTLHPEQWTLKVLPGFPSLDSARRTASVLVCASCKVPPLPHLLSSNVSFPWALSAHQEDLTSAQVDV